MNIPANADADQLTEANNDILNLFYVLGVNNITPTLVLTNDASQQARLMLSQITSSRNPDVAISGNHSDEQLSTKSYSEQEHILKRSKNYAEACQVCGKNEVHATGFMPQSFDQNEETYKLLDELGINYNAGFQAGILFAPGHENDVWPYKVENHNFYAVPVSTHSFSGEPIPLDDRYITNKGITASQWKDLLIEKFDGISGKDEPMVISLSTSTSGSGEYFDAIVEFIKHATSANASFVTANDLVQMSSNGVHDLLPMSSKAITAQEAVTSPVTIETNMTPCPECESLRKAVEINQKNMSSV